MDGLTSDTAPALAAKVTDSLAAFAAGAVAVPAEVVWAEAIQPVLAEFAAAVGEHVDPVALRNVGDTLERIGSLPLVPEHRDCSPWNVVVDAQGQLGLLDWESARVDGLPVLDLVYFLANTAFLLDGTLGSGREASSYRALLDGHSPFAPTFEDSLRRYGAAVGVDRSAVRALRALTWMVHAPVELNRLQAERSGVDRSELVRRSVFVALWNAEMERGR